MNWNKIIECVPNFSEGRDLKKIDKIVSPFRARSGVKLLDYSNDEDHNRLVVTLVGEPAALCDAVIEAIGIGEPKKMTEIARQLSITTGTLTKSMNGLEKKSYVNRKRSEEDKRVVQISLTDKGVRAYHHHENFHKILIERVTQGLSEEEIRFLIDVLGKLKDSFQINYKIGELMNDMFS